MTNPMVVMRAIGGLSLPFAMAVARWQRRSSRREREHATAPQPERSPVPGRAPGRDDPAVPARLHPRELRARVEQGGDLSGVDLRRARLSGVSLRGVDLDGRDLRGAVLQRADLTGASLRDALLDEAHLGGACLQDADLTGASLFEADLSGCDLRGARLSGSRYLSMALLRGAVQDRGTSWPRTFEPGAAGVTEAPASGERPRGRGARG